MPLGDIRRSSCGEEDVRRLRSSVVRAVDRQSKDLGSIPAQSKASCWSPKIDIDIFEEPENQRVLVDDKVLKKMFFIQSRLHMAMQGCILISGVGAQK